MGVVNQLINGGHHTVSGAKDVPEVWTSPPKKNTLMFLEAYALQYPEMVELRIVRIVKFQRQQDTETVGSGNRKRMHPIL